ncbi:transposase for insertion sequence element [Corynebacterium variabile DSM 44702]|uniref:Transposase for insertion sequence element n=1 Tax=Corynebacterium variabile (strain DSM 44702 / CIP 107183 / JCM 12073 / NCIMB 30131) TaxID=858619 RepID=G0HIB5_CORVD|nr:transposase for insertion sequence element [Corynebacterium variabile DSM 44702]
MRGMGHGRRCGSVTAPTRGGACGIVSFLRWWPKRIRLGKWIGRSALTPRSTVPTNTPRTRRAPTRTRGASSNYKNSPLGEDEPAGHGIGRSRGGLTTKIHQVVDGNGRPLAMVVTGGQRNDGAMMQDTLKDIYVPRPTGRPRTTPDTVMADRGYTSGVNREYLRDHHVKAVIPQKKNEIASRKKKGSKGGRPPAFDAEAYKGRRGCQMVCVRGGS